MPEVHAILSASSSKRWLNCTPSARLEQNFPNESSVYAEEGTAAHALGEYKLRKYLHERVRRPTSEFDNEEMDANTDIYAEFIITTVEKIKETSFMFRVRISASFSLQSIRSRWTSVSAVETEWVRLSTSRSSTETPSVFAMLTTVSMLG